MSLVVIVPILNEREHLPSLLRSIQRQTRLPDRLILVDDGSSDGSYELAQDFARLNVYATALRRPPRPPEADRLATAAELRAFLWGLDRVDVEWTIAAKLDADLELAPTHFSEVLSLFEKNTRLGVAGAYLSIRLADGTTRREAHPADHVRGPNKFYRRACLDDISPLPDHLGWDAIDETLARMHGWLTASIALRGGESVHLRPTGLHDGRLRALRRWGECAYGYGSHPVNVVAGGVSRARRRPWGLAGIAYVFGWLSAYLRRRPRAAAEVRAFRRAEELSRIRQLALGALRRPARELR